MDHDNDPPGTAATVAALVKDLHNPTVLPISTPDGTTASVLLLPKGVDAHNLKPLLEPYRTHPERRRGTARLQDLDSLIAHVNRFKDQDSALFADRDMAKPSITAVLDYHEACDSDAVAARAEAYKTAGAALPRWGTHRAHYAFPLSDEWTAWTKVNGEAMPMGDFAEFLEDRIGDVLAPPDLKPAKDDDAARAKLRDLATLLGGSFASPTRLVELSRGLSIQVGTDVKNAVNLSTGEAELRFAESHNDGAGGKVKVPNLFLIGIPVFRSGPLYQIAVRLRYRVKGPLVVWTCQMYRPEKTFEHAFDEACATARKGTDLPLFMGSPEATGKDA